MRSCSTKDVTMFRSIAHRWDDVRPSLRYGMAGSAVWFVRYVGVGGEGNEVRKLISGLG